MKKIVKLAIPIALITLTGCATNSFQNEPVILGVSSPLNEVTISEKKESKGTMKLNVFSCSHGITLFDDDDFVPSPVQYIDRYVKTKLNARPEDVSLDRFDVYLNRQLPSWRNKTAAFSTGLGLIGGAISNEMKNAAIDEGTDVVGCKGEERGEFSVFELGGNPDFDSTPVVTYIEISINGKKFKGRGFKDTFTLTDWLYFVSGDIQDSVSLALEDIEKQVLANKS